MLVLLPVGGLWQQLVNFCFFLSALWTDILLIRLSLSFGYLFILINAVTGYPSAPYVVFNGSGGPGVHYIGLDAVIWAIVVGCFHYYFTAHLLADERRIHLKTPEQEAIWRFFYRRSGMRRLQFLEVIKHADFVEYQPGQTIVDAGTSLQYFHLVLHGIVRFQTVYNDVPSKPAFLRSGDFFDLEVANIFGVHIGFESDVFTATALTPCRVMRWSFEEINRMASHCAPAVAAFWRNMLLFSVANELNRRHEGVELKGGVDSAGELEDPEWLLVGAQSRDFTRPLSKDEEPPKTTVVGVIRWALSRINPWPLPGMRHTTLPTSGVLARNRVQNLRRALMANDPKNYAQTRGRKLRRTSLGQSMLKHAAAAVQRQQQQEAEEAETAAASATASAVKRDQNGGVDGGGGGTNADEEEQMNRATLNNTLSNSLASSHGVDLSCLGASNSVEVRAQKRLASLKLNSSQQSDSLSNSSGSPRPRAVKFADEGEPAPGQPPAQRRSSGLVTVVTIEEDSGREEGKPGWGAVQLSEV